MNLKDAHDIGLSGLGLLVAFFLLRVLVVRLEILQLLYDFPHLDTRKLCCLIAFLVGFGAFVARDQRAWFWSPYKYHEPYSASAAKLPASVSQLYHLEIAYYLLSLITQFIEPNMKDFWIMFMHHLTTLVLLVSSYEFGATKYGAAIMLLHDISDPFMEVAKLFLYCGYEKISNVFLAIFGISFVALRDFVYPVYIIWPTWIQLTATEYTFRIPTMTCLVALWWMHLFWTVLILKIVKSTLCGGPKGDLREKED